MKTGLFICLLAALVALAPRTPHGDNPQTRVQLATARTLAQHGSLDITADGPSSFSTVHAGRRYATAGFGNALFLTPFEGLLRVTLGSSLEAAPVTQLLESALSAALVALTCVLFFGGLRELGVRRTTALPAAVALAFATPLFIAGRVPDGTALATLLLYVAFRCARGESPWAALGLGLSGAGLILVEPTWLPVLVVPVLSLRRRDVERMLAVAVPVFIAVAAEVLRRRTIGWFPPPPADLAEGLDGLLLSTGKSLFLYCPLLVACAWALPWWWRTRRAYAATTLALCTAGVLCAALTDRWHGDPTWGPRRLVPLVPILLEPVVAWADAQLPFARRRTQATLAALALLGLIVQGLGAAFTPTAYLRLLQPVRIVTGAPAWFDDPPSETHFIPQFSPLRGHAWMLSHLLRRDPHLSADAPWVLLSQNTPKLEAEYAKLQLDWWVLAWPRARGSLLLALLLLTASLGSFIVAWAIRRPRVIG